MPSWPVRLISELLCLWDSLRCTPGCGCSSYLSWSIAFSLSWSASSDVPCSSGLIKGEGQTNEVMRHSVKWLRRKLWNHRLKKNPQRIGFYCTTYCNVHRHFFYLAVSGWTVRTSYLAGVTNISHHLNFWEGSFFVLDKIDVSFDFVSWEKLPPFPTRLLSFMPGMLCFFYWL